MPVSLINEDVLDNGSPGPYLSAGISKNSIATATCTRPLRPERAQTAALHNKVCENGAKAKRALLLVRGNLFSSFTGTSNVGSRLSEWLLSQAHKGNERAREEKLSLAFVSEWPEGNKHSVEVREVCTS